MSGNTLVAQVFAAGGQRVKVTHLISRVDVAVGRTQRHRQRVVIGGGGAAVAANEAQTVPRSRWPG